MTGRGKDQGAKRRWVRVALAVAVLLIVAGIWAGNWAGNWAGAPSEGPTAMEADDPAVVARGARLYAAHCASCHGADLQGETPNWRQRKPAGTLPAPPHDASGHTWHHPDDLLFAITKHGGQATAPPGFKSAMPGFGDTLGDGEIWAVLSFIKSRWPRAVQARQESISERAR